MRYITKMLAVLACLFPITAYGFGSAEDVRIAKDGTAAELACDKTVSVKKEVSSDSAKALETRITALEKELKSKSNEKLAKAVFEAKARELDKKFANYTTTTNQWIDEKFGEQDSVINEAVANAQAAANSSAASAKAAKATEAAVEEKLGGFWSKLLIVIVLLGILYAITCIIGVVLYKRR